MIGVSSDGVNCSANVIDMALGELVSFKIKKDKATPEIAPPRELCKVLIKNKIKFLFHNLFVDIDDPFSIFWLLTSPINHYPFRNTNHITKLSS